MASSASIRARSLARRVWSSASSWLRIELICWVDLGLAGEHVELQLGIGEHGEQLALLDHGAVLDQHLLDPAALDRVEEDGERGLDPRAQRQEIVEPALRSRSRW